MTAIVSRPYAQALTDYGRAHPEVVALSGDLTRSCEVDGFQEAFPARFFNLGMAEQNLIGVAGGMARAGLLPVVHSFGVFIARRACDQVQMAIGTAGARVRLMGFLPGITTPGGPTHQAIDDVAVMGSVPGMTVLDPGDATEVASVLEAAHDLPGPVYCRMVRGDVPRLFETPLVVGRSRLLAEGADLLIISASVGTWEAIEAAARLRAAGVAVGHVHVATLKPFGDAELRRHLAAASRVITVENHLICGGLGSRVAEILAESGCRARLVRLGIDDRYAGAGSLGYLADRCGLSARHILAAAARLLDRPDLAAATTAQAVRGEGDLARQERL